MRVVVVGLGLFGTSVAEAIVEAGGEVLAIEKSETLVQQTVDRGVITHAVCVDATHKASLERLGVGGDYDAGVVGIGTALESSVIATIHLKDLGVPKVLSKAIHATHRKILEKVGADETLIPELISGRQAARGILNPCVLEELEISTDFTIIEIEAPAFLTGKTLAESNLRQDFDANVIGYRRGETATCVLPPDYVLEPGDVLIIGMPKAARRRFVSQVEAGRA